MCVCVCVCVFQNLLEKKNRKKKDFGFIKSFSFFDFFDVLEGRLTIETTFMFLLFPLCSLIELLKGTDEQTTDFCADKAQDKGTEGQTVPPTSRKPCWTGD